MQKPRVRIAKNTRTEIHADRRTKRQRTRAAEEQAALDEADRELDEAIEEILDWTRDIFG